MLGKCATIKLLSRLIANIYDKVHFSPGLRSQVATAALTKKTVILKAPIFPCQMCVSGTQTRLGVPLTHMWNGDCSTSTKRDERLSPDAEALKPVG